MKMISQDGFTSVEFQNQAAQQVGYIDSSGKLEVSSNVKTGGYISVPQMNSPGAASANRARLFAKAINGETYLVYIDDGGRERVIRSRRDIVLADSELVATNLGTTFKDYHYGVSASLLSRNQINFDGYTEARVVFAVDNNEADTIECRAYNETDASQIATAISDSTGNAQLVTGSWTAINITGDKSVQAQCREGTGATADPDLGILYLQLR
jgi:hypothetical protein